MIVDCDDEFAEEELTEEEKDYLKGFYDLDNLCLVCPPDPPSIDDLMTDLQRTITSQPYPRTRSTGGRTRHADPTRRQELDRLGTESRFL